MKPETNRKFFRSSFLKRWFKWKEVENSFWVRGVDPDWVIAELREISQQGGIYVFAWGKPRVINPKAKLIKYIGETSNFKRRMDQFATSAGFWKGEDRDDGHSAGWRWPRGKNNRLHVAFYVIQKNQDHVGKGFRTWYEAQALEIYRRQNGCLPIANQRNIERIRF